MEEIELDSCFNDEEMDKHIPEEEHHNECDIQNLQLQNTRLQEINSNLQASIEGLKSQLKEALDTVNSMQALSTQIQQLKTQLKEEKDKNAQLTQQIKEISANNENETKKLKQEINALQLTKSQLENELDSMNGQKNKLRLEKRALRKELDDKDIAIETLLNQVEKFKLYKKKLLSKSQDMTVVIAALQKDLDQNAIALEKEQSEKSDAIKDIESHKSKIESQSKCIDELKSQINSLENALSIKENALSQIEANLNEQEAEIEKAAKDKQKFVELLQKQSTILTVSEMRIESLQKEIHSLQNKLEQKSVKDVSKLCDISCIEIPFEGELKSDCETILKTTQLQPMQRIQKIFNDVAVYLSQVETELRNLKISQEEIQEQTQKNGEKAEMFRQILQSILKDFKSLVLSENYVNQSANIENDDKLITFMTQKCSEIDPLIRENVMRDNHFISDDFFFTNDVAKKKKEIQSIAEQSGATFAILTAQFLSNEILQSELLKYTTVQEKPSSEDTVVEEDKKDKMEQNIIENQQLQQQVEDITKQLNNYKSKAKKSLNSQMELQKADIEQKAQIKQLQIQVDNLKSELDVANMKLQVALNDIETKEHEKSEIIEQFNNQLAQNIEEAVKSKVEEIEQLNTILKQTQIDNASAILQKNKQIKKQEEQFRREIGNLQDQIGAIVQKTEEKRKKQRRNQKLLEQQHQNTIIEMNSNFESMKQNMNQVIDQLKEKAQQSNESIEKISHQLNQCENENKLLKSENENLTNSQKKLQSEFNVMKNQIGKERQQISGQLAAQTMVYEAKIQKAVKEAKDTADKKINEFLEYSYNKFNGFYDIDGGEFGEESFKQLLTMIKSDLEKLNYFQNEATKFIPNK